MWLDKKANVNNLTGKEIEKMVIPAGSLLRTFLGKKQLQKTNVKTGMVEKDRFMYQVKWNGYSVSY